MRHPAASVIDTLGIRSIKDRVGVVETAVINAKRSGIPARWYPRIRDMCREQGLPCPPDEVFNFAAEPRETGGAA